MLDARVLPFRVSRGLALTSAHHATRLAPLVVPLLLAANALAAYQAAGIPLPWIGTALTLPACLFVIAVYGRLSWSPEVGGAIVLLLYGAVVTAGNALFAGYPSLMPSGATTPYPVYVGLRLLNIAAFVVVCAVTLRLCRSGHTDFVVRSIVAVGLLVALAAVYLYFADVHELAQLPRNRQGTGLGAQPVRFHYPFHRAMGTFREPSHMAEWLVVPFFLSFAATRRFVNIPGAIMAAAITLSGSLAGVGAAVVGFAAAAVVCPPFRSDGLRQLARLVVVVVLALVAFRLVAVPYLPHTYTLAVGKRDAALREAQLAAARTSERTPPSQPAAQPPAAQDARATAVPTPPADGTAELGKTLVTRLTGLIERGPADAGRGTVVDFWREYPVSLVGAGFGNANLLLTHHLNTTRVVSFLSLYANVLFSTGVVGMAALIWLLFGPVVRAALRSWAPGAGAQPARRSSRSDPALLWVLAGYIAWLALFAVNAEELTLPFAVVFALLADRLRA